MTIYFIGGASTSGKSEVAKKLAKSGCPIVGLDDFHIILMKCIVDCENQNIATEAVAETAVRQLLDCRSSCLVEGGWIKPNRAFRLHEEFGSRFQPMFCGFPKAIASERLKVIKQNNIHWLATKTDEFAINWLQRQIDDSTWYQVECGKYNLPFFDFSDFSTGEAALCSKYEGLIHTTLG